MKPVRLYGQTPQGNQVPLQCDPQGRVICAVEPPLIRRLPPRYGDELHTVAVEEAMSYAVDSQQECVAFVWSDHSQPLTLHLVSLTAPKIFKYRCLRPHYFPPASHPQIIVQPDVEPAILTTSFNQQQQLYSSDGSISNLWPAAGLTLCRLRSHLCLDLFFAGEHAGYNHWFLQYNGDFED